MKIVKLNRRHNAYKKWGFPVGIRFDSWNESARAADVYLSKTYNTVSYQRPDCVWSQVRVQWYANWGNKSKNSNGEHQSRPYWIFLRNEADVSAVLLTIDR